MEMDNSQYLVGFLAAAALVFLLWRQVKLKEALAATAAGAMFADLEPLLENVERKPGDSAGSWKLSGRYAGEIFQFTTVVDTLAVRKLPSLWLLVTLPKPQPVTATWDVMMRPAAHSTFSRFDFLPHTLRTPPEFPPEAIIRSDAADAALPLEALRPALQLLLTRQGKEILISPKGLRIVIQLAEADRARYGVFREARFDSAHIDGAVAATIMNTLLAMDKELASSHGTG
ncbi:MAG: hypothetical protein LCH46_09840 [Proteobacteria bacterium]|nr:hypothetical protein [Pseudomonadota bacterium]